MMNRHARRRALLVSGGALCCASVVTFTGLFVAMVVNVLASGGGVEEIGAGVLAFGVLALCALVATTTMAAAAAAASGWR